MLMGTTLLRANLEFQEGFTVLQFEKQKTETLPFFINQAPSQELVQSDQTLKFRSLPKGITAHFSDMDSLGKLRLHVIRYLSDSRLMNGNTGAVGLLILGATPENQTRYAPIAVAWHEDEGSVDDFSVSPIQQIGNLSVIWLRKYYSGSGHHIEQSTIVASEENPMPHEVELFDDSNPLAKLQSQGWETWHRGNYFDETTLTWHYHLHRDPSKAPKKDEEAHRFVRVRFKFKDGKLLPEEPEQDEPSVR